MNQLDQDEYRDRYVQRLHQFGHAPETLGWRAGTQEIRFTALTENIDLRKIESVLDVGCGFGDLSLFLRQRGFTGHYLGIDLVPELLSKGKLAYPDEDFEPCSISELDDQRTFDLVIASGIFNARLKHVDQWSYITDSLAQMLHHSRQMTTCDFLTSYVDFRREDLHYTAPEEAFRVARTLTRRVQLKHDYLPFEFAVTMFRQDQLWNQRFFEAGYRPDSLTQTASTE